MSSHLMKNPNTQKSTRQGSNPVRRIVKDEKDGLGDSVQEVMEITGESEEVVRGAFLDVGNNKQEAVINYILDNKGKLSEEWKTAGSKRNKSSKNEVKVHKEEYDSKRGRGRKNDNRGRGDRRPKSKDELEFSDQRFNNYNKENNYRQKNEQRYYRQDNRSDRGYDRTFERSERYGDRRRGGRRGGAGRGGGRAGYRNVNNRSYNNKSKNEEPKQESNNSWSDMMKNPDWDTFRNEDEVKPVPANGHVDSFENDDWSVEPFQESLKETREFKSASNDQAFPVEASIENEVESPPVEKKVQEGIKIDINKLFGTSVNTSEASKSVTASVNEAENNTIVDTTIRLSQTELADKPTSMKKKNDEHTPSVEAENCDKSLQKEVTLSDNQSPKDDAATKSNTAPVPPVEPSSPVMFVKSEENDATKRIKAQLGIPTKSSNVLKFGFNDQNVPEVKQEIRKGSCKTNNHVVVSSNNELMKSPTDGVSMPKGAQSTENTKSFSFGDFTASPKSDDPTLMEGMLSGAERFMLSPSKEDSLQEMVIKHKSPAAVDLNEIFNTVDTHQVVASPSAGVSSMKNVTTPTKFEQTSSQHSTPVRYNEEQQNISNADTNLRVPPGLAPSQPGLPQSQPISTISKPQQFTNFPPQGSMGNIVHSNESTNQQASNSVTNGSYYPSNDQLTSQVDSPSAAANSIRSPAAASVKQQNKNITELIQQPNQQAQSLGGLINSNVTSQLSQQQHPYISQPQIPLSGGYQHPMYSSQQQMQQKAAASMYQQPATTSNMMPVISTAPQQHNNMIKSSIPTNQMLANNKATNQVLPNNFNMLPNHFATPLIPSHQYPAYYDPLYNNQLGNQGNQQRIDIQTQQQNSSQQQQAPNHAKFNRGEPASPVQNMMNNLMAGSSNNQQQAGQSNHNQAPKAVTQQQTTGGQPTGLTPGHHQHFVQHPMPFSPYNAPQLYYHQSYGPFGTAPIFPQQVSHNHAQNAKQVQPQYNSYSAQQQATNTTANDIQNKTGFPANHMISAGGGSSTAASGGGSQTVQPMHQSYFPHHLGFVPQNAQLMQQDVNNQAVGSQRTQQNTSQLSGKNPGGNVKPPFGSNPPYWSQ